MAKLDFFKRLNATIFRSEKIDTHGGSVRIFVCKDGRKIETSVKKMLKSEESFGIKRFKTYENFGKKVYKIRKNILKNFGKLKKNGSKLIGYGAPAKATTALNFYGITNQIDFIVEDNALKHNKFIPGVKIPIKSKKNVKSDNNTMIVFAWNFFKDIKKNNSNLSKQIISIKDLEN